jgi:hypothetical protein
VNTALFFAFLVFSPVMTTLLLAFGCTRYEDDRKYLTADLSIDCNNADYRTMLIWAGCNVVVFVVGIPLTYFVALWRHRAALEPEPLTADERQEARFLGLDAWSHLMRVNDPTIQHLAFLWQGYTPECWWFEVFEMARKFLMNGAPILLMLVTSNHEIEVAYGLLITGLTSMVHALRSPYLSSADQSLLLLSQLAVFIGLVAGLIVKLHNNDLDRVQTAVTWLVMPVTVPIALLMLFAFCRPSAADRVVARRYAKSIKRLLHASEKLVGERFTHEHVQPIASALLQEERLDDAAEDTERFVLALSSTLLRARLLHENAKKPGRGRHVTHNKMEVEALEAIDARIQALPSTAGVVAAFYNENVESGGGNDGDSITKGAVSSDRAVKLRDLDSTLDSLQIATRGNAHMSEHEAEV